MEHECMIYSNNPEPDHLALYFDRDGEEVFREEFHLNDKEKDFEYKYQHVSQLIQKVCPELWDHLDGGRNFRRKLRTCQWIETRRLPCL